MLEFWGMWSTPSLPLLSGPLWLGEEAPGRVLLMSQFELLEIELFDHLTVCIYKMCLEIMYLIYMYKKDLALNNQQCLICHKTKPT